MTGMSSLYCAWKGWRMIELASVIRDLRSELERAVAAGVDQALRFELGPVELEVSLVVERSDGAGGRVRFWVAEAGGEHKRDLTGTQRITLSLTPRLADTSDSAFVNGLAGAGER